MKKRMSNNSEARKRIRIGTEISQYLVPIRSRPEVGAILGMSAESVRQIETQALFKIQKRLGIALDLDTLGKLDIDWSKI